MTVQSARAKGLEPRREDVAVFGEGEGHEWSMQLVGYTGRKRVVDLLSSLGEADLLFGVSFPSKGAAYQVVVLPVQKGILALDREVAGYRPEFVAESEGAVALRELLVYWEGVVGVDDGFSMEELDDRLVAEQQSYWLADALFDFGLKYASLDIGACGHSRAAGSQTLADPRTGFAYGCMRRLCALSGGVALDNEQPPAVASKAVTQTAGGPASRAPEALPLSLDSSRRSCRG